MTPQTTATPSTSVPGTSPLLRRILLASSFAGALLLPASLNAQLTRPELAVQPLAAAVQPLRFAAVAGATSPFPAAMNAPVAEDSSAALSAFSSSAELPDDPAVLLGSQPQQPLNASLPPQSPGAAPVAPRYASSIPPGWTAQSITARDKVVIGLNDSYSLISFAAMLASAGYEQVLNGAPNYGTDAGAFGQRLGAAALRETSQSLFSESVFAPLLHQDPRYYEQGRSHSLVHRGVYAVTRTFITRNDSGHETLNSSLLLGYAASAALSYTYYPARNQNFHDTAETFGGSLGGAALGFLVNEFGHDFFEAIHLAKRR